MLILPFAIFLKILREIAGEKRDEMRCADMAL